MNIIRIIVALMGLLPGEISCRQIQRILFSGNNPGRSRGRRDTGNVNDQWRGIDRRRRDIRSNN